MEFHLESIIKYGVDPSSPESGYFPKCIAKDQPEIGTNTLINLVSDAVLILDNHDQLVYANRQLIDMFNISENSILGSSPGELIKCVHAETSPGGCGSTDYCDDCELRKSILLAKGSSKTKRECRVRLSGGAAFDLEVHAESIRYGSKKFTLLAIKDISDEKRRKALERTFFHDILNTAGVIHSASKLMNGDPAQNERFMEMITRGSLQLIEEIKSHRLLVSAERGELAVQLTPLCIKEELQKIMMDLKFHSAAKERQLTIDCNASDQSINTDPVLFRRIMLNLIKNALEASEPGDTTSLDLLDSEGGLTISVHNPSYIPIDVQHQIFQRSYSTKGEGRGIGTYSVKLFVEHYLKGRVWFDSALPAGTVFYVFLPKL